MAETPNTKYSFANSNSFENKNIKFLSGTQTDLNKYFLGSGDLKSGTAVEGAFYLTLDTHRLYIGRKIDDNGVAKVIPIPVNEGIQAVSTISNLPNRNEANAGEFYYINSDNILAIYNGKEWVQINPDTDNTVELTSLNISAGKTINGTYTKATTYNSGETYYTYNGTMFEEVTTSNANNLNSYYICDSLTDGKTLIYTIMAKQSKSDKDGNIDSTYLNSSNSSILSYLVIPISDLTGISKLGITNTAINNNSTSVKLDGEFADNTKTITITGGNGVTLEGNASEININSTTYNLQKARNTSQNATIMLSDNNSTGSGSVEIVAGESLNLTSDDQIANNQIIINHNAPGNSVSAYQITPDTIAISGKNYYIYNNDTDNYELVNDLSSGATLGNLTTYYELVNTYGNNPTVLADGATVRIPSIQIDNKGHINHINDIGVTLPSAVKVSSIAAGVNGSLVLTNNDTTSASAPNETFYYDITIDGETVRKVNQSDLGSFYSANKIDKLIKTELQGLNALVYKGVLQNADSMPTVVSVGDTYLIGDGLDDSILVLNGSSQTVQSGDLLIANGNEYILSTDSSVDDNKIYYTQETVNGEVVYRRVDVPTGDPSYQGYYENTGIINGTVTWTLVKSGDIDTTYSLFFNPNSTTNTALISLQDSNSTSQGQVRFVGGNYISIDTSGSAANNGTIVFNHIESDLITSTAANVAIGPTANNITQPLNSESTFNVPTLTVDRYGHITAGSNVTYKLPLSNSYSYNLTNTTAATGTPQYDTTLRFWRDNDSLESSITFIGDLQNDGGISVAANTSTIEIKHRTLTLSTANNTTSIAPGGSFSVLTNIATDKYGHITNAAYTEFTLPAYKLNNSYDSNTHTITTSLYDTQSSSTVAGSAIIKYTSDTLNISSTATGDIYTYSVNLEWEDFN